MLTGVSKSLVNVSSPVPLGVIVRLSFEFVWIVAAPVPPSSRVGFEIATVPVVPPILRVVAAPAKLTVVAIVFTSANVVEPVVKDVVISGEVPNTEKPVPVSSDRVSRRTEDNPV